MTRAERALVALRLAAFVALAGVATVSLLGYYLLAYRVSPALDAIERPVDRSLLTCLHSAGPDLVRRDSIPATGRGVADSLLTLRPDERNSAH